MADYSTICVQRLSNAGFVPTQKWLKSKEVSVSENGKIYSLTLNPSKYSAVFQIDGEIISDGAKCDKLVVVMDDNANASIFVELKGKNISHAIDQLESTLNHRIFTINNQDSGIKRARIVTGGSGPTSSSNKVVTDAKIRFLKKYNCDLRILKSRQHDVPL